MKRSNRFHRAIVTLFVVGLGWATLAAAGQEPVFQGGFGTPSPQAAVTVEPEENGYVLYSPISRGTSDDSGSDDGAQLSLKLRVSNTGLSSLHLTKTIVSFAGPPFAASAAFETDKVISPSQTATVHLQDNVVLPGVNFNFKLSEPPPHHVIIELHFLGYNQTVSLARPLAPHQNATVEGSYLFPAKHSDLKPGEFWSGSSSGIASHHDDDERLDFDMGVVRWDEDEGKWKGQYPGKDGTENTDFLVWGKPVYAVANGVVESLVNHIADQVPGEAGSSANTVKIRVGDEVVTYLHLRQFSIPAKLKVGDPVSAGEKIGEVGNSGHSTSPHLHFGVRHAPAGMSANLRPSLFRNIHLIDRTRLDPEHVGGSPWESVNGKSLTWVKNAIWPSSAAPSDARGVVR